MDFRRSGTNDERRRRVLMDEIASPASDDDSTDVASTGAAPKGPVRAYSPAVLEERLPLISSLIPLRPSLATIAVLLAVTAVSLLETIHIYARTLPIGSAAQLAAFDATAPGGVAAWFSSIVLAPPSCRRLSRPLSRLAVDRRRARLGQPRHSDRHARCPRPRHRAARRHTAR